jgi:DNA-binding GntR family transcriptional regulator
MVRLLREKDLESLKSLMQRHLEDSKESCLRALRNREF